MANFKDMARKATELSELMTGREQISTEEIIKNYPEGITVIQFDIVTVDGNMYPVCTFKEDASKYFNGGAVLFKICNEWVNAYDGDISFASQALEKANGVKMKFTETKTKKGNNLTKIEIV